MTSATAPTAPKCGSNGIASTGYYIPKLMEEILGTKFDIVLGYQSGQDVDLAVERGEVVCRAFTITAYFAREPFISWQKRHFVNVLMQSGAKRDSRIKEAPTIYELMDKYKTTAAGRSLAKVVLSAGDFGRPLVAPPGVPADRIKILRDAFDKSVTIRRCWPTPKSAGWRWIRHRRRARGLGQRSHGRDTRCRPENAETAGSIISVWALPRGCKRQPRGI